ncbi:sulfurtransferase [Lysinibacillus yapensis]|uniref:Sulfurtransferase n=1 Tax=Ureibacillus yapensis TaxID=2304605 RepID=A0A396SP75_9BACL|nr:sulfurtransferase [Lysinibacillus yapensis]RHW37660.1 sulfurtransferase [Lysinibacillus yapensis]
MGTVFVSAEEAANGRLIDARFHLAEKDRGKQEFREGHIKGAIYWDLEENLSDMAKKEGRHPMPSKEQLQNLFEVSGLTYEDQIYIYDQGGEPFAARAWWMLKFANFPNVYIVNGGFQALKEAGLQVTDEVKEFQRSKLSLDWNEAIFAARNDVKKVVDGLDKATLLDARAGERYRGEHEAIDKVAGHIPTAKNFDWEQLKQDSELHGNAKLRETFDKEENIIVYCGSGVTASPLYAVLADLGYHHLRLYVGSYSDWILEHEIETGENK